MPQKSKNKVLDTFCESLMKFPVEAMDRNKVKPNFTKHQWDILEDLCKDKSIIIKEADKGSTTVIMDKCDYKEMVLKIIQYNNYYVHVTNYNEKLIFKKLEDFVEQHKESVTEKEKEYITKFTFRNSNFYGLPKIHKSETIKDMFKENQESYIHMKHPKNLKLRPIIAGPSCETHRLSNYLDILLNPFLKYVKSYVKDDIDILQYLPKEVTTTTILASFDAVNLYSNIPHSYGIEAIQYWLEKYPQELPEQTHKNFIIKGIKFILENNYFVFNNEIYRQIKGTAMGTIRSHQLMQI